MTSERLGEMFESDFADMYTKFVLLVFMGVRAEGLGCADPVARTPIIQLIQYIQDKFQWCHSQLIWVDWLHTLCNLA